MAAAPTTAALLIALLEEDDLITRKLLSLLDPLSLRSLASSSRQLRRICRRYYREVVDSPIDLINCSHARILYSIQSYLCGVYEWTPNTGFLLVTPSSALYWLWYSRVPEVNGARLSHYGPLVDRRLVLRMAHELREISLYTFSVRDGSLLLDVRTLHPAVHRIVGFVVDAANASMDSNYMYLEDDLTRHIIKPIHHEQAIALCGGGASIYYRQVFSPEDALEITLDGSTITSDYDQQQQEEEEEAFQAHEDHQSVTIGVPPRMYEEEEEYSTTEPPKHALLTDEDYHHMSRWDDVSPQPKWTVQQCNII